MKLSIQFWFYIFLLHYDWITLIMKVNSKIMHCVNFPSAIIDHRNFNIIQASKIPYMLVSVSNYVCCA